MTPKEKAEELVSKFYIVEAPCFNGKNIELEQIGFYSAKQCALIAVDEIIDAIKNEDNWIYYEIKYWEEVRQEIENL